MKKRKEREGGREKEEGDERGREGEGERDKKR